MESLRVIGVDPGLARMGYGVIDQTGNHLHPVAFGCLETPPEWSMPRRLQHLYDGLQTLVRVHRPAVMAVEELYFYRNVTTAFAVGQARGVAVLAGVQANLDYASYTPMQVKQAVTGYGKADKRQVQEMVRVLLGLAERPQPDDTADALAVAIAHAHSAAQTSLASPPGVVREAPALPGGTVRPIRYARGVKP
ncbi:MAG: crossover junction endodeoxyribonuclease RuvC [Alicyclobacillus sp.]|nr:crossover junction endodeoxyribonuclease RuvC [Alicyclobacillus sp.]